MSKERGQSGQLDREGVGKWNRQLVFAGVYIIMSKSIFTILDPDMC